MFLPNLAVLTLGHASFEPLSSLLWVCGFFTLSQSSLPSWGYQNQHLCKTLAVSLGWPLAFCKALAVAIWAFSRLWPLPQAYSLEVYAMSPCQRAPPPNMTCENAFEI